MAHLQSNPQQRALPPHFNMYPTSQSPAAAGPSSQPALAPVDSAIAAAGPIALPPGTDEDDGSEENIFRDMTFEDVLDELAGRFLVNLPEEENSSLRLYWQAEQAHWFYEDYLRPLNPLLPALSQRQFTHLILASSPVHAAAEIDYDAVWQEYCAYKKMVPCCGGILINQSGDKALMVRGWKSNAGWCFPRGKINSEESDVACAIREVEEETGFDLDGLVNPADFIKTQINAQEVTMFIVKDIDESTVFETQTRKEIGAIEWVPLIDLPTWTHKKGPKRTAAKGQKRFYNVTPFVGPLKKWLQKRGINPHPRKKAAAGGADTFPAQGRHRELQPFAFDAGPQTELDHLFAKFVQKDDNVDRLESDRARSLDQLFSSLYVVPADGTAPTYPQETEEQRKEDDALARLLGGIGAPPAQQQQPAQPAAAPPTDAKQTKLLAMLNPAKQQAVGPPSPPRSTHQSALLSMLSPPGSGAPASASSTLSSADTDEERRNRQRGALLESLFPINTSAPMTPPAPGHLRPQSASLNGMISPMPPMPPSQSWQTPTTASPSRGMGTPPMQQQRQYAQSNTPQVAVQPPPGQQQQQQQQPYPAPPQQQQPYPVQQQNLPPNFSPPQAHDEPPRSYGQSPPGPATDHQRNLLGTLFSGPRGGPGPNGSAPPQMGGPVGPPPGSFGHPGPPGPPGMPLPFNGGRPGQPGHGRQVPPPGPGYPPQHPNPFIAGGPPPGPGGMGYPPPPPGMMPRGPPGGFGGPQGYSPGPPPPGMVHGGFPPQHHPQQQLQQAPPPGQQQHQQHQQQQQQERLQQQAQQAQQQAQQQQSLQPMPPLPPQTAQKLVSPSAVHQPVPRPPVGHELLGLINGR